eukprot:5439926-Prymnesium_polylepis.1
MRRERGQEAAAAQGRDWEPRGAGALPCELCGVAAAHTPRSPSEGSVVRTSGGLRGTSHVHMHDCM